jgi:hypothetical protein
MVEDGESSVIKQKKKVVCFKDILNKKLLKKSCLENKKDKFDNK